MGKGEAAFTDRPCSQRDLEILTSRRSEGAASLA
jgi:hypothetical protein